MDSLEHRRRVGALTYLYKLQSCDAPDKLRQMIPPKLEKPPRGRVRASAVAHDTCEDNKYKPISAGTGPDYIARRFPFNVIDDWNRLPAEFFADGFELSHLQSFKCKVNDFFRRQPPRIGVRLADLCLLARASQCNVHVVNES